LLLSGAAETSISLPRHHHSGFFGFAGCFENNAKRLHAGRRMAPSTASLSIVWTLLSASIGTTSASITGSWVRVDAPVRALRAGFTVKLVPTDRGGR
jgi:hypothetical protein